MQTAVSRNEALKLFFNAAAHWADEQTRKEREADALRCAEEAELTSLPWYRRWFYTLDEFTGLTQDVEAFYCGEQMNYCHKQLEILNTLSPLSVVRLSQRDLNVLNIGD